MQTSERGGTSAEVHVDVDGKEGVTEKVNSAEPAELGAVGKRHLRRQRQGHVEHE